MVSFLSVLGCRCTDRRVCSYLCQGKRKSITGVRKRPKKTATLGGSAVRPVAAGSSRSESPVLAKTPRPRELLSVRNPPLDNLLSREREADRVDKQRERAYLAFV